MRSLELARIARARAVHLEIEPGPPREDVAAVRSRAPADGSVRPAGVASAIGSCGNRYRLPPGGSGSGLH